MIKKHDATDEYYFEEGCHIIETSNSADDEGVSIAQARVEKGHRTKWHYLKNTTERYVILSGCARVEVGTEEPCDITPGDVVIVPANTRQRIKNTGEHDLLFLAICSPRFQKKNYREGSI
ncbi:MAG: cupin domain-containing protein [Gammaproteobacteria bacterium]|nr:cupin domain-containing protein [Gammaproteobacteria bacterium]